MLVLRYVQPSDLEDLHALSQRKNSEITSNVNDLVEHIRRTMKTRYGMLPPDEQGYMFVLEDTSIQRVVGTFSLEVNMPLRDRHCFHYTFNKLIPVQRQASTVHSFFIDPKYDVGKNKYLLFRSIFLFLGTYRNLFPESISVVMKGFSEKGKKSPFQETIGNPLRYANIPSDTIIYTALLPRNVKKLISEHHPSLNIKVKMFEREGITFKGYVSKLDGGPYLDGRKINQLTDVHNSRMEFVAKVALEDEPTTYASKIITNENYYDYRTILSSNMNNAQHVYLNEKEMQILRVKEGAQVRVVGLSNWML